MLEKIILGLVIIYNVQTQIIRGPNCGCSYSQPNPYNRRPPVQICTNVPCERLAPLPVQCEMYTQTAPCRSCGCACERRCCQCQPIEPCQCQCPYCKDLPIVPYPEPSPYLTCGSCNYFEELLSSRQICPTPSCNVCIQERCSCYQSPLCGCLDLALTPCGTIVETSKPVSPSCLPSNPFLPTSSPVSAFAPIFAPYTPPRCSCGRCHFLKKICIPPPCL